MSNIPDCLMYCGTFGHEFSVTRMRGDFGVEVVTGQCNTVEIAREWLKPGGHIYRRTNYRGAHWKRRWKRVE
jgi:hypothetical protein